MDREPGEQLFFHGHPCWRSRLGFYTKGFVGAALAGALAGVMSAIASGRVQAGWLVGVVLIAFLAVLLAGFLGRLRTTYTITDQRLAIETGLLSRERRETRLQRVQHINTHQTMFERILCVGTVAFDTAAGPWDDLCFHGVSDPHQIARTVGEVLRKLRPAETGV
ncbi:MAG: PH domain-containing protein [Solirubrobacteraceae bacterium]